MKKENKASFVILGMLLDQPRTGYEIREMIKKSTNYFWQESDASIYPALKRLEKEGKVESRQEFTGKRRKVVFTLTEPGRQEFAEWIQRPADLDGRRQEFLLKFFFMTEKDSQTILQHLDQRLRLLRQTLDEYLQLKMKLESFPNQECPRKHYWLQTLNNGISHVELDIAWAEQQRIYGIDCSNKKN